MKDEMLVETKNEIQKQFGEFKLSFSLYFLLISFIHIA